MVIGLIGIVVVICKTKTKQMLIFIYQPDTACYLHWFFLSLLFLYKLRTALLILIIHTLPAHLISWTPQWQAFSKDHNTPLTLLSEIAPVHDRFCLSWLVQHGIWYDEIWTWHSGTWVLKINWIWKIIREQEVKWYSKGE